MAAFLRTLTEDDWEQPSLCEGWRVRDVVAHLLYDDVPAAFVPRDRGALPPGRGPVQRVRRLVPRVCLGDALVHHQDIRRPLGRPREVPAERVLAALQHPDPFARPWRFTRGLRGSGEGVAALIDRMAPAAY